jgi:hypothetical protein
MPTASPYKRTLIEFIRAVAHDHVAAHGLAGEAQVRFELGSGLYHGGRLAYPAGAGEVVAQLNSVSSVSFQAAVMTRHRSLAGWVRGETITKPKDPARNLFVPSWYTIISIDVARMPIGAALALALREATTVKPRPLRIRF